MKNLILPSIFEIQRSGKPVSLESCKIRSYIVDLEICGASRGEVEEAIKTVISQWVILNVMCEARELQSEQHSLDNIAEYKDFIKVTYPDIYKEDKAVIDFTLDAGYMLCSIAVKLAKLNSSFIPL